MTTRAKIRHYLIGAACAVGALVAPTAHAAGVLRICADPDNLPFSKAEGPERGLYVELANMVARRMGDTAQYVWWLTFNKRGRCEIPFFRTSAMPTSPCRRTLITRPLVCSGRRPFSI